MIVEIYFPRISLANFYKIYFNCNRKGLIIGKYLQHYAKGTFCVVLFTKTKTYPLYTSFAVCGVIRFF